MKTYRIKKIFKTIQGEGFHAGTAAVFVRFVGCNMWSGYEGDRLSDAMRNGADCPLWCDTDFTKEGSSRLTAEEIINEVRFAAEGANHVVFTGGEPLLQMDSDLLIAFNVFGFHTAVETNGTKRLNDAFTSLKPYWVTVSPKLSDSETVIEMCNEAKFVVPDYHPNKYPNLVSRADRVFVQPVDDPARTAVAMKSAVDAVMANHEYRISVQGHKILMVE